MLCKDILLLAIAFTSFPRFSVAQLSSTCCSIDPNSVDSSTRQSWCRAQINACPSICGGTTSTNTCDPNALTYSCICQGNNTPNISDYSQTLPSLECNSWKSQCVAAHPNDLAGQSSCLGYTCGQRNASSNAVATSSASTSTHTNSYSSSFTSSATSSATSGTASASSSTLGSSSSTDTATASTSTTLQPSYSASATSTPAPTSGLTIGATVGIGVGAGLGALILGLIAVLIFWRYAKRRKADRAAIVAAMTAGSHYGGGGPSELEGKSNALSHMAYFSPSQGYGRYEMAGAPMQGAPQCRPYPAELHDPQWPSAEMPATRYSTVG